MSLDVHINFNEPRLGNYFLEHPYSYSDLSESDKNNFNEQSRWSANITHNLGQMASNIPVNFNGNQTTLYYACWRPDEIGVKTAGELLPLLVQGLHYMIDHRSKLMQYESPNGWGTYNGFMKFLLNYKQACEDNAPECKIDTRR